MLKSNNIKESFYDFFSQKGHKIMPSSSLLPKDDTSVLLTTAGMQQFKEYFTGELDALKDFGTKNISTIQKCFRTSDIDEVGDNTHLTFFEMLGNFSFGGYYKQEAISFAFEYITKILKLKIDYITVFEGSGSIPKDDESINIWKNLGIPEKNIKMGNLKDNFWGPTGSFGPCGPTTEIYINGLEVWNIVFNEYYCSGSRESLELGETNLRELPFKGIDTGMGLERLMYVLLKQSGIKINSFYETDIFANSIEILQNESGKNYFDFKKQFHIIADHIRAAVFLINDGVLPSNIKAGYILRRIIRRMIKSLMEVDLDGQIIEKLTKDIVTRYSDFYQDLKNNEKMILDVALKEAVAFSKALKRGLRHFNKILLHNKKIISGQEAFYLFQSFGFPLEMIKEIAREKNIKVDEAGFNAEYLKHKEASKSKIA